MDSDAYGATASVSFAKAANTFHPHKVATYSHALAQMCADLAAVCREWRISTIPRLTGLWLDGDFLRPATPPLTIAASIGRLGVVSACAGTLSLSIQVGSSCLLSAKD